LQPSVGKLNRKKAHACGDIALLGERGAPHGFSHPGDKALIFKGICGSTFVSSPTARIDSAQRVLLRIDLRTQVGDFLKRISRDEPTRAAR